MASGSMMPSAGRVSSTLSMHQPEQLSGIQANSHRSMVPLADATDDTE